MNKSKSFTLIELLLVIAIVGLLSTIVVVITHNTRAEARDGVRIAQLDSLRKVLEFYYAENGEYPEAPEWISIEEDPNFASAMVPAFLASMPQDPLFGQTSASGVPYSYQYTTADTGGEGYRLHVEMERVGYVEEYGGSGEGIVYGGGEGESPSAPNILYVGHPSAQLGDSDPINFAYATPFFSFINNHGETITAVQIQLTAAGDISYNDSVWDSGNITVPATTDGDRIPDIFYGVGTAPSSILALGQSYIWRARTRGAVDSDWSANGAIDMTSSGSLTARFYAGEGDGEVYSDAYDDWYDAITASAGSGVNDDVAEGRAAVAAIGTIGTHFYIGRAFFPIDTQLLPNSAAVTSAALNIYISAIQDDLDDYGNAIGVVQSTQASVYSLTADDYGQCGGIGMWWEEEPARSDFYELSGLTSGDYNALALNSAGIFSINKSGYTQLGVRVGFDSVEMWYENDTGDVTSADFYFSERPGLSQDPYLEIAYIAQAAPIAPSSLYVGYPSAQSGVENPVDFAYSTPYLSAIYNDLDAGDVAKKYRIQLTTSGDTSYANPLWDSEEEGTILADCAQGARCEDIFYGGATVLSQGANYIWRIKFWDSYNSEGSWSSNATIDMSSGLLTSRFYLAYNSGSGYAKNFYGAWDEIHDSATSIGINSDLDVKTMHQSGYGYSISRSFMSFDTSALPDTSAINSADLNFYVQLDAYSQDNDGNDFIVVLNSSQASPTSLVKEDYDQCGAVDNPVEGSNRLDITTITDYGAYNTFVLNNDGRSWVSTTGYTTLGVREGHDILDIPIDLTRTNTVRIPGRTASMNTRTYLEIVHD